MSSSMQESYFYLLFRIFGDDTLSSTKNTDERHLTKTSERTGDTQDLTPDWT